MSGVVDFGSQQYLNAALNTGRYFSEGGFESEEQFRERGAMSVYSIARDGKDNNSVDLTVNHSFTGAETANMRCVVFDRYRTISRVQISHGRVVSLQTEQA